MDTSGLSPHGISFFFYFYFVEFDTGRARFWMISATSFIAKQDESSIANG